MEMFMKHRIYRLCLCVMMVLSLLGSSACIQVQAAAKTINLRLGTLAPRGTSFHKSLMQMGEKWRQVSGGTVRLTIYPDGTQGSEADMVGLMQTGNLDAGLLTSSGLSEIEPAVNAQQNMPLMFNSLEEVDYVTQKLRPMLEKRMLDKGYIVLFWTDSGWVRFFSKSPVVHPDDLRRLKLFTWAGNTHEYDLWKASGFNPVALETAGIAQGLMSDTINAIPMPPFYAMAGQLYNQTKYMLELNWGCLVGAAVVKKKSWDRLDPQVREAMLKIAAETGQQIKAEGRKESQEAVAAMVKRGLIVNKVTPEIEAEWRAVIDKVQDQIRGKIVPADMFDESMRILKEYRSTVGKQQK